MRTSRGALLLLLVGRGRGLLEGLDQQRGSAGNNLDLGLSVLDDELDSDLHALPFLGRLGNVVTDLLGGQTERTDLGGERGNTSGLTTGHADDD